MSVTVNYSISAADLNDLDDAGYTKLRLWYSNYPDGPWAYASVEADQTIAAALAADTDALAYDFTFTYTGGNAGQHFRIRPYNGAAYADINDSPPFPGGGGYTAAYIRRVTGLLLGDLVVGAADAGGDTDTCITSTLDVIKEPDDHYNGKFFNNLTSGDKTIVSDWVQSTKTFTLSPAITSIAADDGFEITGRWTPEEYRVAINEAIKSSYPVLNRNIVHEGYLTEEDVFSYNVPGDIRTVSKVEIGDISDSTTNNHPWREIPFKAFKDGLTRKIEFKRNPPYSEGQRPIRIWGTGPLQQVYEDSDLVEVDDHQVLLLSYKTAFHLYTLKAAKAASTDRAYFQEMAKFYLSLYNENAKSAGSGRQPRRNWSQTARWRVQG